MEDARPASTEVPETRGETYPRLLLIARHLRVDGTPPPRREEWRDQESMRRAEATKTLSMDDVFFLSEVRAKNVRERFQTALYRTTASDDASRTRSGRNDESPLCLITQTPSRVTRARFCRWDVSCRRLRATLSSRASRAAACFQITGIACG